MLRRAADPHRRGDPARGVRATRDVASRAGLAPRALPGLGARHPGACRPGAGRRRRRGRGVAGARPASCSGSRRARASTSSTSAASGWMAFHEYVGGLRAQVSVNTDLPRSAVELLHTVLHETYAGHHAESCLKEVALVRGRGLAGAGHRGRADAAVAASRRAWPSSARRLLLDGEHRAGVRSGRAEPPGSTSTSPTTGPSRPPSSRCCGSRPTPASCCTPTGWSEDAVLDVPPPVGTRRRHPARARRPLRRRSREPGVRRVLPGGPRALPGVRER